MRNKILNIASVDALVMNRFGLPKEVLYNTCSILVGIYFAFYLSGILSYATIEFPGVSDMIRWPYYALYGGSLAAVLCILVTQPELRGRIFRLGMLCAVLLLPVFLMKGGLGVASKSYVVGIASLLIFTSLAFAGDVRRLAQFGASIIGLSSLFVLADAGFVNGFSSSIGRSASLYGNPNVAALTLLLGTVGTVWAVSPRWRLPFCTLVAGAVFSTLSRSSMMLGGLVLLSCMPLMKADWRRHLAQLRSGLIPGLAVGAIVIGMLSTAAMYNKSFVVASSDAFQGLRTAYAEWEKLQSQLAIHDESTSDPVQTVDASGKIDVPENINRAEKIDSIISDENVVGTASRERAISLMSANLVAEAERANSASARAILFQRALGEYREDPILGHGMEHAFKLAPHNLYLLLAVAFGLVGWLLIPLLMFFMLNIAGWRRGLPAAVLLAGAAVFSHDVLLALPLVASLVLVLSGLFAIAEQEIPVSDRAEKRVKISLAVIALGLCGVVLLALFTLVTRPAKYDHVIPPGDVISYGGNSYYALLPAPAPKGMVRLQDQSVALMESGLRLGPGDAYARDIQEKGQGRYAYANLGVLFSASDNSNPAESDKQYRLIGSIETSQLSIIMIFMMFAWALMWVYAAFRQRAQ